MSNPTITIAPYANGFAVSLPFQALGLKKEALERANKITEVNTPESQEEAIAAVSTLKGLSAGVERSREAVKKPYLEAGRAIDAKAKEYAKELDERAKVIESMIGEYQRAERAKVEAARQAEETKRREAEAALLREQAKAAQAERARLQAEKESAEAEQRRAQAEIDAMEAKGAAAKKKAQMALAKQEEEARVARQAQLDAEQAQMQAELDAAEAGDTAAEAAAIIVTPDAPKATGASIRDKVEFEVTDIEAFYAWDSARRAANARAPSFVKLEIKKGDFSQYINLLPDAALDEIPGVTFTKTTKAAVRSALPGTLSLQ